MEREEEREVKIPEHMLPPPRRKRKDDDDENENVERLGRTKGRTATNGGGGSNDATIFGTDFNGVQKPAKLFQSFGSCRTDVG